MVGTLPSRPCSQPGACAGPVPQGARATSRPTVVPAAPGSMVTCSMSARIRAMPCPRSGSAPGGVARQRPVSVTVSRSRRGRGLGAQPDLLARRVAVAVLDGVGAGLPRGDQDVLDRPAAQRRSGPASPAAPRGPVRAAPVGGKGQVERAPGWRYSTRATSSSYPPGGAMSRHHLAGQVLHAQHPGLPRRRRPAWAIPSIDRHAAAFDQAVGVQQQRRPAGQAAGRVAPPRPRAARRAGTTGPRRAARSGRPGGPGCPAGGRRCCRSAGPSPGRGCRRTPCCSRRPGTSAANRSMARQGLRRAGVLQQQGPAGAAQLAHHGRGVQAVPDAVTDHDRRSARRAVRRGRTSRRPPRAGGWPARSGRRSPAGSRAGPRMARCRASAVSRCWSVWYARCSAWPR